MKKFTKIIAVTAITAAMIIGGACIAMAGEITVSGKGEIEVKPDLATINLSIETKGDTAMQAQNENVEIMKKAVEEMTKMGISEKNIKTSQYSVSPEYYYEKDTGERTQKGFRAYNSFQIITSDVDNTGKYIDTAMKIGLSESNGVSFSVKDTNKYYEQALDLAVKNASGTATVLAKSMGQKLGTVKSVTESPNYQSYASRNMAMSEKTLDAGAGNTDIRYDNVKITAEISMVYNF